VERAEQKAAYREQARITAAHHRSVGIANSEVGRARVCSLPSPPLPSRPGGPPGGAARARCCCRGRLRRPPGPPSPPPPTTPAHHGRAADEYARHTPHDDPDCQLTRYLFALAVAQRAEEQAKRERSKKAKAERIAHEKKVEHFIVQRKKLQKMRDIAAKLEPTDYEGALAMYIAALAGYEEMQSDQPKLQAKIVAMQTYIEEECTC
jgi:hypothetical protein